MFEIDISVRVKKPEDLAHVGEITLRWASVMRRLETEDAPIRVSSDIVSDNFAGEHRTYQEPKA